MLHPRGLPSEASASCNSSKTPSSFLQSLGQSPDLRSLPPPPGRLPPVLLLLRIADNLSGAFLPRIRLLVLQSNSVWRQDAIPQAEVLSLLDAHLNGWVELLWSFQVHKYFLHSNGSLSLHTFAFYSSLWKHSALPALYNWQEVCARLLSAQDHKLPEGRDQGWAILVSRVFITKFYSGLRRKYVELNLFYYFWKRFYVPKY